MAVLGRLVAPAGRETLMLTRQLRAGDYVSKPSGKMYRVLNVTDWVTLAPIGWWGIDRSKSSQYTVASAQASLHGPHPFAIPRGTTLPALAGVGFVVYSRVAGHRNSKGRV